MKRYGIGVWVILGVVLLAAGCAKKTTDNASLTSSAGGFDTATTEELAQLPQVPAGAANQQTAVEVLPVETAPVTPAAPAQTAAEKASVAPASSESTLDHNKKIQTALKNAGVYQGSVDGKIGPASKRAIEAFQKNNGLKVDGKVGHKTWKALEPYMNGSAPAPAAAPATTPET